MDYYADMHNVVVPTFFQALNNNSTKRKIRPPIFHRSAVVEVSFRRLTKEITLKICRLCVYVIINKRPFEVFVCLDYADKSKSRFPKVYLLTKSRPSVVVWLVGLIG